MTRRQAGAHNTPPHCTPRSDKRCAAPHLARDQAAPRRRDAPGREDWSCCAPEVALGYHWAHPNGRGTPHSLAACRRVPSGQFPCENRTGCTGLHRKPLRSVGINSTPVSIHGVVPVAASGAVLPAFPPSGQLVARFGFVLGVSERMRREQERGDPQCDAPKPPMFKPAHRSCPTHSLATSKQLVGRHEARPSGNSTRSITSKIQPFLDPAPKHFA